MMITLWSLLILGAGVGLYWFIRRSTVIVPEDHNAVIVNRQGFVKRVLPAGVYHLKPGLEKIEFTFETKTKLVQGVANDVPTAEGILLTVHWSGIFARDPNLITEKVSQRLRGLPTAHAGIQRKADIALRRLIGSYSLQDLFRPAIRERVERQLTAALQSALKPSGIIFSGLDLQSILPPEEVRNALNQAQAIHTLDSAIRTSDTSTREIVVGAHQLEDLIEWSKLLPPYGRYAVAHTSISQ